MIPFLSKFRKNKFEKIVLSETKNELYNPSRGWYKIFYFVVGEEIDWEKIERDTDVSHSLVMLFFDIGNASERELEKEDFEYIQTVFSYFEKLGKDIILRFAYDHVGKAIEREPNSFNLIKKHAASVAKIINENSKNIFVYQGLLIGNWGEMHTSKHLTGNKLTGIYEILKESDESVFLSLRKPSHLRFLNPDIKDFREADGFKTGIYNDGMFGSETDLGTYGIKSGKKAGYEKEWLREEEIDFIHSISLKAPVGGETVSGGEISFTADEVMDTLSKTGVTYLNSEYDRKLLDKWEKIRISEVGIWNGETLYDYISAHMGYRFIISKTAVKVTGSGMYNIGITITNLGYAPIYFDADVVIELENGEEKEIKIIKNGLNGIEGQASKNISADFSGNEGVIRVSAQREKDGRIIRFAHECDSTGRVTIGKLKCLK